MNKKGFTLIELIATITIIGIVSLLTVPALGKIMSDNNTSACKYYEKVMIEASKSYIQKEGPDIIENSGSFPSNYTISLNSLISLDYIDEYDDTRTKITNGTIIVNYNSTSGTYSYTPHYVCSKKSGEELYRK